jgi:hypothetical protein
MDIAIGCTWKARDSSGGRTTSCDPCIAGKRGCKVAGSSKRSSEALETDAGSSKSKRRKTSRGAESSEASREVSVGAEVLDRLTDAIKMLAQEVLKHSEDNRYQLSRIGDALEDLLEEKRAERGYPQDAEFSHPGDLSGVGAETQEEMAPGSGWEGGGILLLRERTGLMGESEGAEVGEKEKEKEKENVEEDAEEGAEESGMKEGDAMVE